MKSARIVAFFLVALAAVALCSCATKPAVIPEGLSAAEIFQRAQDAADRNDFALGISYYSLVEKSFPDDKDHIAWASYEIAFLYHKMGQNDLALKLANELLARYAAAGDTLPAAPQVLAQNLKKRLEAESPPAH